VLRRLGSGQTDAWLTPRRIVPPCSTASITRSSIGSSSAGPSGAYGDSCNASTRRRLILVIEPLPDVAREAIESVAVHPLDEPAPDLDNDGRRR
jgi:hypothetical protein